MEKFYLCTHCGNLVEVVKEGGAPLMCCGQKMTALTPNTVEASAEKHLPMVTAEDGAVNVNVGSVNHPMIAEHHIMWVYLETDKGGYRKNLTAGEDPNVTFCLQDEKAIAVYAYCNLHGLWKTSL